LPPCLLGQGPATLAEIGQGLRISGHFLDRFAAEHSHRALPEARNRLIDAIARLG
jgi:DNA repair protein RecO (recombination protein O)